MDPPPEPNKATSPTTSTASPDSPDPESPPDSDIFSSLSPIDSVKAAHVFTSPRTALRQRTSLSGCYDELPKGFQDYINSSNWVDQIGKQSNDALLQSPISTSFFNANSTDTCHISADVDTSSALFGPTNENPPGRYFNEFDSVHPLENDYSIELDPAKKCADLLIQSFNEEYADKTKATLQGSIHNEAQHDFEISQLQRHITRRRLQYEEAGRTERDRTAGSDMESLGSPQLEPIVTSGMDMINLSEPANSPLNSLAPLPRHTMQPTQDYVTAQINRNFNLESFGSPHVDSFTYSKMLYPSQQADPPLRPCSTGKPHLAAVSKPHCNCKKTKCLKLYCDCFNDGSYCAESCGCRECFNKPDYEDVIEHTRKEIETRNPLAFAPRVVKHVPGHTAFINEAGRHKTGCNCRKSMCIRKYCECYQASVGCSNICRCDDCKNPHGRREGQAPEEILDSIVRTETPIGIDGCNLGMEATNEGFFQAEHGKDVANSRFGFNRYTPYPKPDLSKIKARVASSRFQSPGHGHSLSGDSHPWSGLPTPPMPPLGDTESRTNDYPWSGLPTPSMPHLGDTENRTSNYPWSGLPTPPMPQLGDTGYSDEALEISREASAPIAPATTTSPPRPSSPVDMISSESDG